MIKDIVHFFFCVLAIFRSFFVKCLFKMFAFLLMGYLPFKVFFFLTCRFFLSITSPSPLRKSISKATYFSFNMHFHI